MKNGASKDCNNVVVGGGGEGRGRERGGGGWSGGGGSDTALNDVSLSLSMPHHGT